MKIDAVVVTYNRIEKLKKALDSFSNQTEKVGTLVVVNNASTDEKKEYLEQWKEKNEGYNKVIINLNENIGGSGGFGTGIDYLVEQGSNWIWVSDDDAYLDENAIKNVSNFLEKNKEENISAICGEVINKDKTIALNHRRILKKGKLLIKEIDSKEEDYKKESFDIDLATYVATIMSAKKIKEVGSTNKEFFLYYDDSDHTIRLRKAGRIICVPSIIANHDVNPSETSSSYTWKTYYLLRNRLFFYKFNFEEKYYKFEKILIWLRIFKQHKKAATRLIKTVLKDFDNNKLGMSEKYKPGIDINKV